MGLKLLLALIPINTIDAAFLQNILKKIKTLTEKSGY